MKKIEHISFKTIAQNDELVTEISNGKKILCRVKTGELAQACAMYFGMINETIKTFVNTNNGELN